MNRRCRWFLPCAFVAVPALAATGFHTSPACWDEPRIHAEERDAHVEVRVERIEGDLPETAVLSPNRAYAFHLDDKQGTAGQSDYTLRIDNERPYLLELRFPEARGVVEPDWVNEKLLFVRTWWGRVAGTDYLVDVEKEAVVLVEPFRYGAIAFQQFRQCDSAPWKGTDACRCASGREASPSGGRP